MSKRVIADGMASRRQLRNLTGIHRLPIFPNFVARPGVRIDSRSIKLESLISSTLRESGYDKEHSAGTKRFEQRRGHGVVARSPIIKCKENRRLGMILGSRILLPQRRKVFQTDNRKMFRDPIELFAKARLQRCRSFMHSNHEAARSEVKTLHAKSQLIGAGGDCRPNQECARLASNIHRFLRKPTRDL